MQTLFILIIIGVLSAIFGKGKNQRTNRPLSKNSFTELKTMFENQLVNKQQAVQPENNDSVIPSQKNLKDKYVELKQTSQETQEGWTTAHRIAQKQRSLKGKETTPTNYSVEAEEPISIEEPDAKNVINGIIWSEILGEPRAKKPYSPRRS